MNSGEKLIRQAVEFGKDPKLSGLVDFLLPIIDLVGEVKNLTQEQIVDYLVASMDPCIGSEPNALIGGEDNPNAPVKVDIPLLDNDGTVLEFSSDVVIEVLAKYIKSKLASVPPVA